MRTETAYFAAGCFWGPESAFRAREGVLETAVGYMGGQAPQPSYRDVCSGTTGHAETVKVVYDPATVTYGQLLDIFFDEHDPTQLDRQGPDVGSQYRSALFVDEVQAVQAEQRVRTLEESGRHAGRRVVTQVVPLDEAGEFWPAEDYHQQYLEKQGRRAPLASTLRH